MQDLAARTSHDLKEEIDFYEDRLQRLTTEIYADLSSWERVQVARHPNRPLTTNYIDGMCEDFIELHGDGLYGDDRAMATGLATIRGHKVMLVAQRKGQNTKDRLSCNFGSAHPEGYRKSLFKCMPQSLRVAVAAPPRGSLRLGRSSSSTRQAF